MVHELIEAQSMAARGMELKRTVPNRLIAAAIERVRYASCKREDRVSGTGRINFRRARMNEIAARANVCVEACPDFRRKLLGTGGWGEFLRAMHRHGADEMMVAADGDEPLGFSVVQLDRTTCISKLWVCRACVRFLLGIPTDPSRIVRLFQSLATRALALSRVVPSRGSTRPEASLGRQPSCCYIDYGREAVERQVGRGLIELSLQAAKFTPSGRSDSLSGESCRG